MESSGSQVMQVVLAVSAAALIVAWVGSAGFTWWHRRRLAKQLAGANQELRGEAVDESCEDDSVVVRVKRLDELLPNETAEFKLDMLRSGACDLTAVSLALAEAHRKLNAINQRNGDRKPRAKLETPAGTIKP